jgi:hypothetical protein
LGTVNEEILMIDGSSTSPTVQSSGQRCMWCGDRGDAI